MDAARRVAASIAMIWGWSWQVQLNDYGHGGRGDRFAALLHGHLGTFFATAPSYGALAAAARAVRAAGKPRRRQRRC